MNGAQRPQDSRQRPDPQDRRASVYPHTARRTPEAQRPAPRDNAKQTDPRLQATVRRSAAEAQKTASQNEGGTQARSAQKDAARTQVTRTAASAASPNTNGKARPTSPAAASKAASPATAQAQTQKPKEEAPAETIIRLRGAVDRPFLVIVILLVCLGSAMVFSASYAYAEHHFGDSLYFIRSQIRWVAVGFVAMIVVMQFDYRWFQKLTMPAFFGTLALLALVPFIGKTVKGAKRWIEVGPIQIQPSEMMKLALIMVLALYVAANRGQMKNFRNGIFYPYCIIGAVCFITALERHLSATMILLMIGTLVIFIGGAPFKPIGIALGTGGGLVAILIAIFPYARRRVEYWLHPETDPGSAGYQLLQSLYAIGSGGALGVGLGNSRQKYLYLPESQNDFIFAIICEEFGWIGAAAVIVLFGLLLWRGYVIASHAPDTYSSLLTMGIISQIALQCIMNIAVVTGSMPVTGVSLPFFSYGGSSLIMLMGEAGMILAVSRYSYQTDKS